MHRVISSQPRNSHAKRSIQYPIQLPQDFDTAQIDERVRLRGQAFANLEGLAFKAFSLDPLPKAPPAIAMRSSSSIERMSNSRLRRAQRKEISP